MVMLIRNPAIISFTIAKKKAGKQDSDFSPENIFSDNDMNIVSEFCRERGV